ncbi:MAG TPA: hypothetical protein VFA38_02590 [Nitrospirales bacterium]|nr:hypothetical protein [Nitrospirales bacterium]
MAEKFGNGRWVKEGWLDNRVPGCVVGRISFAVIGEVDVYLLGDCRGELAGKVFIFRNSRFEDDDTAGHVLGDFESPQVGEASLISFDPHPLLAPHPYIEWFSLRKNHYRIELQPADAQVLNEDEAARYDAISAKLRETLQGRSRSTRGRDESDWV